MSLSFRWVMGAMVLYCAQALFASNYVLGPADSIAIDQPIVVVEFINPRTGNTDGPADPYAPLYFFLDTGANGILVGSTAYEEPDPDYFGFPSVNPNRYDLAKRPDGSTIQYSETGVAGDDTYDLFDTYQINYGPLGPDDTTVTQWFQIPQVNHAMGSPAFELNSGFSPVSYSGIMGMPAMVGHVVTINLAQMNQPNPMTGLPPSSMGLNFASSLPAPTPTTFDVPLRMVSFDTTGKHQPDDPDPTYAPLPFVDDITVRSITGGSSTGSFLIDTGAQTSIISWETFEALGLALDENTQYLDVGGVGGTVSAPVVYIDLLEIPTASGDTLTFSGMEALVLDIPGINGVLGMSVLTSGYYDPITYQLYLAYFQEGFIDQSLFDEFTAGLNPNAIGAFDSVCFDFTNFEVGTGIMRLNVNPDAIPEPLSITLALPAILAMVLGRRSRPLSCAG